jgi:multidrug resistance efflux pump
MQQRLLTEHDDLRLAALEEKAIAQQQQQQAEVERQQAEMERQQAEMERQQAEAERQQAKLIIRQTVLRLHGMGMAIEQIAEITGLEESEVGAMIESADS